MWCGVAITHDRYQRLEKERAVLKERMEEARQAVSTALNEEIPLRSEQKKLQAEYDRFKKKLGEEDGEEGMPACALVRMWVSFTD
jgi:predicted  nucleic acid-binding Zn-ribbon protein